MTSAPPPGLGYRVRHTSEYAYAEPVSLSMHQVRLTPRNVDQRQLFLPVAVVAMGRSREHPRSV